jgi:hypothetical protein
VILKFAGANFRTKSTLFVFAVCRPFPKFLGKADELREPARWRSIRQGPRIGKAGWLAHDPTSTAAPKARKQRP